MWKIIIKILLGWEKKRALRFAMLLKKVKGVEGDIVECGVGHGKSLAMFLKLSDRKIWGFDSFQGFPELSKHDITGGDRWVGDYFEEVARLYPSVHLVKGFFKDTLSQYEGKIAFLHIDADLQDSYAEALRVLYPKVEVGGIIVFDEYNDPKWPGATLAVKTFYPKLDVEKDWFGKYYVIKRTSILFVSTR